VANHVIIAHDSAVEPAAVLAGPLATPPYMAQIALRGTLYTVAPVGGISLHTLESSGPPAKQTGTGLQLPDGDSARSPIMRTGVDCLGRQHGTK
jgi:hypothetical protein